MKKIFLLLFFMFFVVYAYAASCSCSKDGVSYTWGTNEGVGCGKATGKATKSVNGKEMTLVDVQEAIDACW